MIKRIVEISSEPFHLATRWDQLKLRPRMGSSTPEASIPCEDVGVVIVDHPATTYTHQAFTRLAQAGAAVVLCGEDHLPLGMFVPLGAHTEVVWRIRFQIEASLPLRKRLWKQIVRAKLANQAANLPFDHPARLRIEELLGAVRSGDPENVEGQAARFYWEGWLGVGPFRRCTEGEDAVNAMLNYGYAILRAAVARALISAGLNPALGLHHRNRSNPFCLADDVMEPMRPWVDAIVARRICDKEELRLDPETKKRLLSLLHCTVKVGDQTGPLMVALHRTCASLVRCLQGKEKKIQFPQPTEEF